MEPQCRAKAARFDTLATGDAILQAVAHGALVAAALADAPVSAPVAVVDGAEIASATAETVGIISTIRGILATIDGAIVTIPAWQWALAVVVPGGVTILQTKSGNVADTGIEQELQKALAKLGISMRKLTEEVIQAICELLQK